MPRTRRTASSASEVTASEPIRESGGAAALDPRGPHKNGRPASRAGGQRANARAAEISFDPDSARNAAIALQPLHGRLSNPPGRPPTHLSQPQSLASGQSHRRRRQTSSRKRGSSRAWHRSTTGSTALRPESRRAHVAAPRAEHVRKRTQLVNSPRDRRPARRQPASASFKVDAQPSTPAPRPASRKESRAGRTPSMRKPLGAAARLSTVKRSAFTRSAQPLGLAAHARSSRDAFEVELPRERRTPRLLRNAASDASTSSASSRVEETSPRARSRPAGTPPHWVTYRAAREGQPVARDGPPAAPRAYCPSSPT